MAKLVLLIGLPGSGKSTYAKQLTNHHRINYDDLRVELYGPNWRWNRDEEDLMKRHAKDMAMTYLKAGHNVVIDNTNLTHKAVLHWYDIAKSFNADITEVRLNTPIEHCIGRDRERGDGRVGRAVIERMALWNGFINFSDAKRYPKDFIIVDMDGTLADCTHRRVKAAKPLKHRLVGVTPSASPSMACPNTGFEFGPQDTCPACLAKPKMNWSIFYDNIAADPIRWPIMHMVKTLAPTFDVIVVSGRPISEGAVKSGIATEDWLWNNATFPVRHLFMRQGGDSRPDYTIKEELLDKMIESGLDVNRIKYVLDDRDQVVRMWRKRGLTCLQVADGDF